MTKWIARPHWVNPGVFLGRDRWGDWIGVPAGTHCSRPGFAFDTEVDSVSLVPADGWWFSTFHRPGIWVATYVDITTPPSWDGSAVRAVDLDLDVVRRGDGGVYVDDEDEFAEHQVSLYYPPDVIAGARQGCAEVHAAVLAERAPFDGATAQGWLDRLGALDALDALD